MAYSTQAQVQVRAGGEAGLVALADHDGDTLVDTDVVDSAIADADRLINTYAAKQFTVPFDPVPTVIESMSARMAVYFLRSYRGVLTREDIEAHTADQLWLKALADGEVIPDQDPVPPKHSIRQDASSSEMPSSRDVSRKKLRGFW